jgi:hypothetical protein
VAGDVLGQCAAGVATAAYHVSLLVDIERLPDRRDLLVPDFCPGTWRGGVQGGEQPVAAGGDRGGGDKRSGAQEITAVHVIPPEVGDYRHGSSHARLAGQPDVGNHTASAGRR